MGFLHCGCCPFATGHQRGPDDAITTNAKTDKMFHQFLSLTPLLKMKHSKIALASVLAMGSLLSTNALAEPENVSGSMQVNASALNEIFNLQNLKATQGLTNDCTFGAGSKVCVGVLASGADTHTLDAVTGGLVLAFQSSPNFRFGAYAEQARESQDRLGNVALKKGDTGFGVFAAWSSGEPGSELHVRAAANMGNVFIETTRDGDLAEPGLGYSDVKSTSYQVDLIKDYALSTYWTVSPYVGFRENQNKRAAYTELNQAFVSFPLAYSDLKQNIQTVSAGLTLALNVFNDTQFALSAGVEEDVKNRVDAYSASNRNGDYEVSVGVAEKRKIETVGFSFKQGISSTDSIALSVTQRKVQDMPEPMVAGSIRYSKSF